MPRAFALDLARASDGIGERFEEQPGDALLLIADRPAVHGEHVPERQQQLLFAGIFHQQKIGCQAAPAGAQPELLEVFLFGNHVGKVVHEPLDGGGDPRHHDVHGGWLRTGL